MKAKERHQLKKNELQDTLVDIWLYLQKNGSKVISIIVLVIVIIGMLLYLNYSSKQVRVREWDQLFAVSANAANVSPEDLSRLAQESSDKNFAAFALVRAGDMWLMQTLFDEHADKQKLTESASNAYSTVINKYPNNKIALGSAKMGLAAIYEINQNWDKAKQTYQTVMKNKELIGTGIPMLAKNRLNNIDSWKRDWKVKLLANPTTKTASKPAKSATGKNVTPKIQKTIKNN